MEAMKMPNPKKNEAKQDFLTRCTKELIEGEGRLADQAFAMCNAFWDDTKGERAVLELSAPVELLAKNKDAAGGKKQFMITAYTGKPFQTWRGPIVFDISGMQTKEKMPILREHARDRIVGFGESFTDKDNSNLFVKGEFSETTEDAREVKDLAIEGYPWQASVAVWARKVKILENEKAKETVNGQEVIGPAEIWTESDVGEVSFVTLGRDDNTAAITFSEKAEKTPVIIESNSQIDVNHNETEGIIMGQEFTLEILKESAPDLLAEIEDKAFQAGRQNGIDDERARVVEILEADADEVESKKAIEAGTPAADAYKQFYQAEKSKRAEGLTELEQEATAPQGQDEPSDEQPAVEKSDEELRREWRPEMGPAAQAA
jgi:hypothetical protein